MFFVSLHSSERKFAPAQYVNKERFLLPYLHSLFVICSSARATRTFFSSSFLYLPVRLAPSFLRLFFICPCDSHRLFFVFCSSFVRLFFVFSSSFLYLPVRLAPSFVRHLFVICSSTRVACTVFLLPVHSAMIACRATTAHTTRTVVLTVHLLII